MTTSLNADFMKLSLSDKNEFIYRLLGSLQSLHIPQEKSLAIWFYLNTCQGCQKLYSCSCKRRNNNDDGDNN